MEEQKQRFWQVHLSKSAIVRSVVVFVIVFGGVLLCSMPLDHALSRASIGRLDLGQPNALLRVRFVPPKSLYAMTIFIQKPVHGSEDYCAQPDLPLSLRLRVTGTDGTTVVDDLITKEQMQWTSWHNGPSLLLDDRGNLSQCLRDRREYHLSLSVESAVTDLGHAEVYMHWDDPVYIWGRHKQELRSVLLSTE